MEIQEHLIESYPMHSRRDFLDQAGFGGLALAAMLKNAKLLPRIHDVLTDLGIPIPLICTPEEMVAHDPDE